MEIRLEIDRQHSHNDNKTEEIVEEVVVLVEIVEVVVAASVEGLIILIVVAMENLVDKRRPKQLLSLRP